MPDLARDQLLQSAAIKEAVAREMLADIVAAAEMVIAALRRGGRVAFCGNGGSAADCQHLAGELVGRFLRERPAWDAIALTTNTSVLTAIGNDYGYDRVFARQVEAGLRTGDVLFVLSTSGEARNCVAAAEAARERGVGTVGLTGSGGGALRKVVNLCLCVPSDQTPRVQEAHITIGHVICDLVERTLTT